jgi:hypothetical protein
MYECGMTFIRDRFFLLPLTVLEHCVHHFFEIVHKYMTGFLEENKPKAINMHLNASTPPLNPMSLGSR